MSNKGQNCCLPTGSFDHHLGKATEFELEHVGKRGSRDLVVPLSGGEFDMGAKDGPHSEDGEGPVRSVFVDAFSIGKCAVTNEEFSNFAEATGYCTMAEEVGASFVFCPESGPHTGNLHPAHSPWWKLTDGACWRNPRGLNRGFDHKRDHPVVHIAQRDALAYCKWNGLRLPTEAEWEMAARGGLHQMPFPWGADLVTDDRPNSKTWSGDFPFGADPQREMGPVAVTTFEPNNFGLYNMTGNVWERVADRFTNLHSPRPARNPKGPLNGHQFVAKGGSYLCHASYCRRYRTSSRQSLGAEMTADNIGFRVASD